MTNQEIEAIGERIFVTAVAYKAHTNLDSPYITLKLSLFGKVYSKTMPLKDAQNDQAVYLHWNDLFDIFKNDIGAGNVPAPENNNPEEDDMSLQEKKEALFAAAEALVTEVSGIDTTPYSEEDMAKAKLETQAALEELAKVKSDDEADKAAIAESTAKLEAILAILAPKPTPTEPALEV